MTHRLTKTFWTAALLTVTSGALAFCGFYIAKADTDLFNDSSEVIIAREGQRTVLTMANDYRGDVADFALVVPVPTVLREEQIWVGDPEIFGRLDAYSAPRLVEYFDPDPCLDDLVYETESAAMPMASTPQMDVQGARAKALGVTVEDAFTVGEYDILILSAQESAGLETWLLENGYELPDGAHEALAPYIRQGMKFFVAKVNLGAFEARGAVNLRPLTMAFESENLMLPIQLGMLNAAGPQDLVVYVLSPGGRAELKNYKTREIPSNVTLPDFVEDDFADAYRAIFEQAHERDEDAVLLEYAWDMAWCDPCAADPLSFDELRRAGVFWLRERSADSSAPNVYLTRLHLRYTQSTFPEDLMFRITNNRDNFQGRYILQRPFEGTLSCEATDYVREVRERQSEAAARLAKLTGWPLDDVHAKMDPYAPEVRVPNWWESLFNFGRP